VLEAIRNLAQSGIKVIAYADGASNWTLGERCRPLLAGASCILDSANPGFFVQDLRLKVFGFLHESQRLRDDQTRIRGVMKTLGLVGESAAMATVFRWIGRVSALSDLPVLIAGETGTGKELVAYAIHQLDAKRAAKPFVAVNCAAISPQLAESELFGHRRGAYTGAGRDRRGLVRSADGGVLFLDEVGELSSEMQAKLLRAIQLGRVLGVGEDREVPVDVRIIAATNRDLDRMVRESRFREDLFHRLNVLPVWIPPLRERREDLRPLIEHFITRYSVLVSPRVVAASRDFVDALSWLPLTGNARQLENIVRWALVRKVDDTPLNLGDLPSEVWQELSAPTGQAPAGGNGGASLPLIESFDEILASSGGSLFRSLARCERLLLESTLQRTRGNRTSAARLLGITPRSVYNKIRKHGLPR
jgi:transcriptional regulator with GAF, ATPase, and Fis domain